MKTGVLNKLCEGRSVNHNPRAGTARINITGGETTATTKKQLLQPDDWLPGGCRGGGAGKGLGRASVPPPLQTALARRWARGEH